jgi:hypothetical protein
LHPSFDASSPPGCSPQSHEILLNQGMKYWDSALNARGARTFIATLHKAAALIGWRRLGKARTRRTRFSTKFAAQLSFMPPWSPVYFFSLFFEISSPLWPNRGFWCRLFLTLRITLFHLNLGPSWIVWAQNNSTNGRPKGCREEGLREMAQKNHNPIVM